MSQLPILIYPDPRLRMKAAPIDAVDAPITRLAEDMLETMYDAPGIGLAGTQVNVHKRIVVLDISEARDEPHVLINPTIEILSQTMLETPEGCLSLPGFYEPVARPDAIRVAALDRRGAAFELEAEGMLAVCIQHECDHLEGKLFVDYLSSLKRQRIRKRLMKLQRVRA